MKNLFSWKNVRQASGIWLRSSDIHQIVSQKKFIVVTVRQPGGTTFRLWLSLYTAEVTSLYAVFKPFKIIQCSAFPHLVSFLRGVGGRGWDDVCFKSDSQFSSWRISSKTLRTSIFILLVSYMFLSNFSNFFLFQIFQNFSCSWILSELNIEIQL